MGDLKNMKDFPEKLNKIVSSAKKRFNFEYDIDADVKKYDLL
jgi:hypothetical protein